MKKSIQNEEENQEEVIEITEAEAEKSKAVPTQPLIQKAKLPVFPNANRFGKGMQGNNINNRQRPGRAANRGR